MNKMAEPIKFCRRCGHQCHCYDMTCSKCINDVCGFCNCENERKGNGKT